MTSTARKIEKLEKAGFNHKQAEVLAALGRNPGDRNAFSKLEQIGLEEDQVKAVTVLINERRRHHLFFPFRLFSSRSKPNRRK